MSGVLRSITLSIWTIPLLLPSLMIVLSFVMLLIRITLAPILGSLRPRRPRRAALVSG